MGQMIKDNQDMECEIDDSDQLVFHLSEDITNIDDSFQEETCSCLIDVDNFDADADIVHSSLSNRPSIPSISEKLSHFHTLTLVHKLNLTESAPFH
jgi:hypothetical protein